MTGDGITPVDNRNKALTTSQKIAGTWRMFVVKFVLAIIVGVSIGLFYEAENLTTSSKNELFSAGSYYWEGMYATSFIVDPKEDLVAVFMIQIGTRKPLREKFRLMLYQALD